MKLTQERLAELKTMAGHAKSHFCIELAEAFVNSVPSLIADLEEAKEQLASPYMDGYEAAKEEYRPQIIALEEQLAATRKQLAEAQSSDSVTVRYDLSPLKTEEAIKAKVRELGWLDPDAAESLRRKLAEAQPQMKLTLYNTL